jgi:hypothetical protein
MFRLDKTAFKKQSFKESDNQRLYWLSKSPDERIAASIYLQSVADGFDVSNPPKMDKTFFSKRKHKS